MAALIFFILTGYEGISRLVASYKMSSSFENGQNVSQENS
jgi:hypothetical protein